MRFQKSIKSISLFWRFHILFWLIAGAALFISGTTQTTFNISLIRNTYLTLTGLIAGPFFAQFLERLPKRKRTIEILFAVAASYFFAIFLMLVINAITFEMRGLEMESLSFSHWLSGTMNIALVLSLWSVLYLFLIKKVTGDQPRQPALNSHLTATKGRQTQMISIEEIFYISAAGDYVQIHTSSEQYLKRGTLGSMEIFLSSDEHDFLRVHRSILVNMAHVRGIEAHSKGERFLILGNEERLKSGRLYKDAIDTRFSDQF